jgi:preprotein translocase subunit YajC
MIIIIIIIIIMMMMMMMMHRIQKKVTEGTKETKKYAG